MARSKGVQMSGGGPAMKGGTSIFGMGKQTGSVNGIGCGKSGKAATSLGRGTGMTEANSRKGDPKGAPAFKPGGRA
jgi:hypothetical protein